MCVALMSVHAFTYYLTTQQYKGAEKVRPNKLLQRTKGFQDVLPKEGDRWEVPGWMRMFYKDDLR